MFKLLLPCLALFGTLSAPVAASQQTPNSSAKASTAEVGGYTTCRDWTDGCNWYRTYYRYDHCGRLISTWTKRLR